MSGLAVIPAMRARFLADAGVAALVDDRIYDGRAPSSAAMPYVVIGEPTEGGAYALGETGFSDTVTAHVWSAYAGTKEAFGILVAMDAALAAPLEVDGFNPVRLRREFATVLVEGDDDDTVRHVPARYRFTAWKAA